MGNSLLDMGEVKTKDVKYNIFKFQDHLLEWIYTSAMDFAHGDYPAAFEKLTIVYLDAKANEMEKLLTGQK